MSSSSRNIFLHKWNKVVGFLRLLSVFSNEFTKYNFCFQCLFFNWGACQMPRVWITSLPYFCTLHLWVWKITMVRGCNLNILLHSLQKMRFLLSKETSNTPSNFLFNFKWTDTVLLFGVRESFWCQIPPLKEKLVHTKSKVEPEIWIKNNI